MQRVSHALLFCSQIAEIVFVRCHLDGHVLYDFQSVGLQSYAFHGVVGHQTHLVYAYVAQHLCTATIVALISLESQTEIGIYRVIALLLQFVGGQLIHQSYAAAFLLHIYDDTLALFLNLLHGLVELFATIAASASQNVARHT